MGAVVDVVEDTLEDFVAITTIILINMFPGEALILAYLCDECESFMSDQIGITLGWLGIEEEDVITVQMQDQLLIQDQDFYKNLMTQVAIEHQRTQKGIIDLLAVKSQGVRGSMNKYSSYGKSTFLDGEPTTTVNTVNIDESVVELAIETDTGENITVTSLSMRVPTETEWVGYNLTFTHDYNPTTGILIYTGVRYMVFSSTYNYGTGKYDVEIGRECIQTVTTTVTVTNIDATTDNVHTVVETIVTAYEGIISTTTNTTDVVVPIGTVSNSTNVVTTNIVVGTTLLYVDDFLPNLAYVAHYTIVGSSDEYYWIYFVGSGNAALDNARNYLTDLDMLPIVGLRSNATSITADKESTRYKQSKEILGFIGIDVDTMCESIDSNPNVDGIAAAYVYFGAELGSNDPIQAELIYATMEYIYDDPTLVTDGVHTIRVQEGNYNSSISWDEQERLTVSRTGVPVGTYEGGIGDIAIVEDVPDEEGNVIDTETKYRYYAWVRKQVTSSYYVEYRVYNVSAITLITKGAMYDTVFKVLSPDNTIVIPLSIYFLNKLTPIEQGVVFPQILRMVTYAADIQHLDYYQTEAFFNLIQVVVVIVAIVIFIFTWYTGGATSAAFMTAVEGLLIGMAIGYALQMLLAAVDNPYLKALIVVVAVIVAVYTNQFNGDMLKTVVFSADLLLTAVTQYADSILEGGFSALAMESQNFLEKAKEAEDKLNEYTDMIASVLSTEEVQRLSRMQEAKAYIEGFELQRYRASVDFMCNWDLVKSMKMNTNIYDYDQHYKVNVLSIG
jgi:hypothetical protein